MRFALLAAILTFAWAAAPAAASAPRLCGLVRTSSGFAPVSVRSGPVSCVHARLAGVANGWTCSRAMHAVYELSCSDRVSVVWLLAQLPPAVPLGGGVMRVADWTFRLRDGVAEGREREGRWVVLARAPLCVTDVPQEVLRAWRLRPLTPHGGCYALR